MLIGQDSYRGFLQEELARRIHANSRYSQRAFARHLGMSPGELSEILKGKRKLSLKSALKVIKSLGLNQVEARHLMYLVQLEKSRELGNENLLKEPKKKLSEEFKNDRQLTLDMFAIVSDWHCFAILCLSEIEGFRWECAWIAKQLEISETEVQIAVRRLERVGLLTRRRGKLQVTKDFVMSPEGIPSEAVKSYHRQILNKASQALDLQNLEEREITGMNFAIDPKELPSIKREITEFMDNMTAKYSKTKTKRAVYHLELALFRLSRGTDNGS